MSAEKSNGTCRIGFQATLQLTIQGPLLVHSSDIGPWGIDAIAMRTSDNHLLIPSDQIQGKFREAMEQIGCEYQSRKRSEEVTAVQKVEGEQADGNTRVVQKTKNLANPPTRYPVQFTDFESETAFPPPGTQTITQIQMDETTGATASGTLRVLDCPLRPGELATFVGEVRFLAHDAEDARKQLNQILTAIRWIPSFGSQKSVGFGRLHNDRVMSISEVLTDFKRVTVASGDSKHCSYLVDFRFQDPICVPRGIANGNIYETQDEIPGEALKGAVATLLNRIAGNDTPTPDFPDEALQADFPYRDLCRHFSRVRITMARPIAPHKVPGLPRVVPLSLAATSDRVIDFALLSDEEERQMSESTAPAFAPDWKGKHYEAVESHFGVIRPEKELRVHTAIDSQRRRAATRKLFALRSMKPDNVVWRATVSIDDRPSSKNDTPPTKAEGAAALSQLLSLLNTGWLTVSKTKARGTGRSVAVQQPRRRIDPVRLGDDRVYVIMLRGATLMIQPRDCVDEDGCMKSLVEIDQLYAAYWKEVSGKVLQEVPERRFMTDSLIGGFQAWKYRYAADGHNNFMAETEPNERIAKQKQWPYNPTLVVDPGSVFVLRVVDGKNEEAAARVAEWEAHGLPLPAWAAKAYGDTHHTNIFLPQNGYGEVDINLPCHQFHSLSKPLLELPK